MKLRWDKWLYSLGQAVIGGAAASGSAWVGTAMGHAVIDSIPVMDWRSLGFVLAAATVSNLFYFLKQSPLPPPVDNDTQPPFFPTIPPRPL